MRRFIALSLSFFILINCMDFQSSASFFIKPAMSSDSRAIVKVSYIKPTQQDMPYFDDTMSSFCIGLIKFELKNPQNFMPNIKVRVKVAPPPSMCRIMWNKFKSMVWPPFKTLGLALAGAAVGTTLGSWKYNVDMVNFIVGNPKESSKIIKRGALLGLMGGFLLSDSGYSAPDFKMTIDKIPFKYSLAPISGQEAKTLQAFIVRPGEKKKALKDYESLRNNIDKVNGKTKVEQLADELVDRPLRALINPNIDSGDPFNAIETGSILKYDNYRAPINIENYVSCEEAQLTNLQNAMKKNQFCKNHFDDKEGINISNYSNEILATLSRDNPVQYVAIMVNNSVEAAKLRKVLERSYSATSQLSYRLNISFSTKIISSLPEGSASDEETEREAEIALGTGPSWPARIVSFFVPHGVAGYASSLVDLFWKPIYSGGAWAFDKFKSKFLIEKDSAWVIPQDDNPPWVVPEVEPSVDPPWTIPPKPEPWYKRGWDKVKSWFSSFDFGNILGGQQQHQQNNQEPPGGQQQQEDQQQQNHQEQPSAQQNQNNQEPPRNPYNSGPNYYDLSGGDNNDSVMNRDSVMARYNNNNDDSSSSKASEPTDNSKTNGDDNNNNSKTGKSHIPVTEIDLNAIPQGKNRDGNIP